MKDEIKKLIEQSKDTTFLVGQGRRRSAVKKMGKIGTSEIVVPLIHSLDDEDVEVKKLSFMALNSLKDPTAIEVLRNMYIKTRKKALWQIISKKNLFPESMPAKMEFLAKARRTSKIKDLVNEENFDEILDLLIESEIEDPLPILKLMIEKVGDNVEMNIIKKFVATKNKTLFRLIDFMEWYPPDLDKKLLFILKTEQYQKVNEMLDGADFREILNKLTDPKFPLKRQAAEALSVVDNIIIKDEICQIFIKEDAKHLGPLILKNNWSPNHPRDKIFFYLKTEFLKGFFLSSKIDPMALGGYLEVPHVRESFPIEKLENFADLLGKVALSMGAGEKIDLSVMRDPAFDEMKRSLNEYLDHPKPPEVIKEICDDYLENNNPFLGYLIVKMGWAPEDPGDSVPFLILSDQRSKVFKLGAEAIKPLYRIMSDKKNNLRDVAIEMIKKFKNPKALAEIFRIYFVTMDKELRDIIKENNWTPKDNTQKALFFIFSGQAERYSEVDPEGFDIIFNAYKKADPMQRLKLVEILIEQKVENFIDFLLHLLTFETNPKILRLLCTIVPLFFKEIHMRLQDMLKKLEGNVLKEIIKVLDSMESERAYEMLYELGKAKGGYISFWILKLLEEARWQPEERHEKALFLEMYKIRDNMLRVLQNKVVDPNSKIRVIAALTFAEFADERQAATLMRYVEDPKDSVRSAVAYSLGCLCALSPRSAMQSMDTFRVGSAHMIFSDARRAFMVGSDVDQVAILGRNYRVGTKALRVFAIAALEELQKREALPTLLHAIKDEDRLVKLSALRALRSLSEKGAAEGLRKLLEVEDEEIRMIAGEALGSIMSMEMAESIVKLLTSGEYLHADSLILALGKFDPYEYREMFERIILRPDYGFEGKCSAVKSLTILGDEDVAIFLTNNLRAIRMTAHTDEALIPYIDAIGEIGYSAAYQELATLMTIGGWSVRKAIARAMGNIPERIALVSIIKRLVDTSGWVQLEALNALNRYLNLHFKFRQTKKDLRFVGAIIARLRKFEFNPVADLQAEEYANMAAMLVLLLKHRFTSIYLTNKPKIIEQE